MRLTLFIGVLILVLSACHEDSGDGGNIFNPNQGALDNNLSLWEDQQLDTYQFTVRRGCFCPLLGDVVVMVVDDQVDSAFLTPSGVMLDASELAQVKTVDGYFEVVQQAVDADVDKLEVEYHPTMGYPTRIYIDRNRGVADDEISYALKDLQ